MRLRRCVSLVLAAVLLSAAAPAGEVISLDIDPQAILEVIPLAAEAIAIQQRANVREAKHAAELRKKGIAEVPPCGSEKYVIDAPAIGGFSLNDWGELYIDRRFVTDEEMKTVKKIEAWVAKWLLKDAAPPVETTRFPPAFTVISFATPFSTMRIQPKLFTVVEFTTPPP